ncbi:recombinase family protein [Streptomyces parvulus]|uniref:recombinase family protein n=1 Tax=Streptomyces parvulus TaxID=146923 RepID=UPI0038132D01
MKVPPWKRPELGDWINNRAPEFDQILFWKLDRFVRRISDLHLMIEWCREYDKVLAADKDPIDLDSTYGEMMVTMIAGMARIKAANTGVRLKVVP